MTDRNWIGGAIMRRFGQELDDDELEFVLTHLDGPVAEQAAGRLFDKTIDPRVLGVIARFQPQYEEQAWEKIESLFPEDEDTLGREIFLGFCPRLRAQVRELEFQKKYNHMDVPKK